METFNVVEAPVVLQAVLDLALRSPTKVIRAGNFLRFEGGDRRDPARLVLVRYREF